jgi:hypothetical protein
VASTRDNLICQVVFAVHPRSPMPAKSDVEIHSWSERPCPLDF